MTFAKCIFLGLLLHTPFSYGMHDERTCSDMRILTALSASGTIFFGALRYGMIKKEERHHREMRNRYDEERLRSERESDADESVLHLGQQSRTLDAINQAESADLIPSMHDRMAESCCFCCLFWSVCALRTCTFQQYQQ